MHSCSYLIINVKNNLRNLSYIYVIIRGKVKVLKLTFSFNNNNTNIIFVHTILYI